MALRGKKKNKPTKPTKPKTTTPSFNIHNDDPNAPEAYEIIGGEKNPNRKGLVSFRIIGTSSHAIVDFLNDKAIRTHVRKADHYSGNILIPLGWEDCVRVSVCHYNSTKEIKLLLLALNEFQMDAQTS